MALLDDLGEDLSDVLEAIFEEEILEEHSFSLPVLPNKTVIISEEMVSKVISEIQNDIILPEEMRSHLGTISASKLVPAQRQLDTIIKTEIFSGAVREKAWQSYHHLQPELFQRLSSVVKNQQLSAFLSLKTAEEVIKQNTPLPDSTSIASTGSVLKSGERDIITYIAGFVLFRCKRKFISSQEMAKYFDKLTEKDGNTKLISVKSRGGLTQPSQEITNFFVVLEILFRKLCTEVSVPSLQKFSDAICQDNKVMSLFYDCTYHSESKTEQQEKIFLSMWSLYHKVRCNAKCRHLMEKYYVKTKSASKQKALRKCLD